MIHYNNICRLNWIATVGINYQVAGLKGIFRMPIKVYGKLKWRITGKIVLPENAIRNTLVIGSCHEDYTASAGKAELIVDGTLLINGIVRIGHDCFIGIRKGAELQIGDGCMIGRDSQIHCSNKISIGNNVFAGEMYITDSSEHQIIRNSKPLPLTGTVTIGNGTYLGYRCMLLKGCCIPPYSVVGSGAVCTRDYTDKGTEKLFIAGIPASVKDTGISAIK